MEESTMTNKCLSLVIVFFFGSINAEYITPDFIKNRHLSTIQEAPKIETTNADTKKTMSEEIKNPYFPNYRSTLTHNINTLDSQPTPEYFALPLVYEKLNALQSFDTSLHDHSFCSMDTVTADSLELLASADKNNLSESF